MILIDELIKRLETELQQFEDIQKAENKYSAEQQAYLTECRVLLLRPQNNLVKRDLLERKLNSIGTLSLIYRGLWKLNRRLRAHLQDSLFAERSLYLDEISQLHQRIYDMSTDLRKAQAAVTQQSGSVRTALVDQLVTKMKEISRSDPQAFAQELMIFTDEIVKQRVIIEDQKVKLAEAEHQCEDQAKLIEALQEQVQSLLLKNEQLFQTNQNLIRAQITAIKVPNMSINDCDYSKPTTMALSL